MRSSLVPFLLVLAGCAGPTSGRNEDPGPAAPVPAPTGAAQGIRGKVVKLVGDFTMEPVTGKRVPELVPVHVFKGRVQPFEKPDPRHAALIRIITPEKDGRFEIALPPGEYTLVLEINGKLYLNNWMEDGCWAIAVVRPGTWTDYVIEDVLEATF